MKKSLLFAVCISICLSVVSQELPRRVYLGIRMENLTEDSRRIMELKELHGVLVSGILPSSTAEGAGWKRGDVLLSINGTKVATTRDVLAVLADQKAKQSFSWELMREKKNVKGKSVFKRFPEEKYADLDVVYTEARSSAGLERIIITKPKSKGKLPVMAFIGGMGCYSLDFPLDTARSEAQMLNLLSRAGYLCARLEKPGMGDNAKTSKPCSEVSLQEETEGYVQAIRALKQRPDVDSNAVYIFGHSMGGVFAPLVAQQTPVRGIIGYGLIGSNLIEHLAKTRRTIGDAYAMSPEEKDQLVKDFCECSGYYFVEKLSTQEAAKKKPECGEYLAIFDMRARAYNNELYALNIPGAWKDFSGTAAIMWGESDYIASKDDHRIIADAINHYHPGHAEFLTVSRADHGMGVAADFEESRKSPGPYNAEVGKVVLAWLKRQS